MSTIAGSDIWLTVEELGAIRSELLAVLDRHRDRSEHSAARPAQARQARIFFSTSVRPEQ